MKRPRMFILMATQRREKVFLKQIKQLADIWLDAPQAPDEKYRPYVATALAPRRQIICLSVIHPFIKGRPDMERHPVGARATMMVSCDAECQP